MKEGTAGFGRCALHHAAEKVLLNTVKFIFLRGATTSLTSTCQGGEPSCAPIASAGLPCAIKVLGFFLGILKKHIEASSAVSPSLPTNIRSRASFKSHNSGSSYRGSIALVGEALLDTDTLELLISLKIIHSMLLAEGGNMAPLRNLMVVSRPLAAMIRDELGSCLVLLSSKKDLPPAVLRSALGIFSTLFLTMGPSIRVLAECFLKFVYLKSLHQLLFMFSQYEDVSSGNWDSNSPNNGYNFDAASSNFEELEMILESLADLVSDAGFIPSLYASFDCDPSKPDVVQPLIHLLSRCTRHVLAFQSLSSGPLLELGSLCVTCYMHLIRTLSDRCPDGSFSPGHGDGGANYNESQVVPSSSCEQNPPPPPILPISNSPVFQVSRHLRASRLSKQLLMEAAKKFVVKPELGLRFLQDVGGLPTPLTPSSVAKFLRIAPGLPKENTGAYLGELGKDSPSFEADGKEFHKQVLRCYVKSFELAGQSVLNCMRIFLSAFRLPGEAQQIDRILVTFSEYCHQCCIEGSSGEIENPEITYLLTFSIIMLNTDRHNPNIRADRKMTVEQFVRNNMLYGSEVNQKVPLSKEYLEGIYKSISDYPIRTERNDLSAIITPEMWMDLQLQAEIDPVKGLLITTSYCPTFLKSLSSSYSFGAHIQQESLQQFCSTTSNDSTTTNETSPSSSSSPTLISDDHYVARTIYNLLTSDAVHNPFDLSSSIFQAHGLLDADLLDCIWHELLGVGLSPFVSHRQPSKAQERNFLNGLDPSPRSLRIGIDILLSLMKLAYSHHMQNIVESIILVFADLSGSLKGNYVDTVVESLSLGYNLLPNSAFSHSLNKTWSVTTFFENLMHSMPARIALGTLLQVVHNNPNYIGDMWPVIWHLLSLLRDCTLLPHQMVLESDADNLPDIVAAKFESRLQAFKARALKRSSSLAPSTPTKSEKKSSSFLSLLIFGSGNEKPPVSSNSTSSSETTSSASSEQSSTRWDSGYEGFKQMQEDGVRKSKIVDSSKSVATSPTETSVGSFPDDDNSFMTHEEDNSVGVTFKYSTFESMPDADPNTIFQNVLKSLRDLVSVCGVSHLVADTRFLAESQLLGYFQALIFVIEKSDASCMSNASFPRANQRFQNQVPPIPKAQPPSNPKANFTKTLYRGLDRLRAIASREIDELQAVSPSSCAWLEIVLVESALRNRDRFPLLWESMSNHYMSTLSGANVLSYSFERRVSGILKVATRMISREQVAGPILDVLGALLTVPGQASSLKRTMDIKVEPISSTILLDVAEQISVGVWRLLTLNVSALPMLRLEHWQIIFDIVAVSASAGGFASIKAFEAMAWLLHEPRLRAEVPVFCIVGLRPLLCNTRAPESVSVGAVHLLTHLHTRLEVLAKNENGGLNEDYEDEGMTSQDGETPALWESCWVPILQALADGVTDERLAVRTHAVHSLSNAILDKHSFAVPAGILVNILGDIIVPTLMMLGESTLQAETKEKSSVANEIVEQSVDSKEYGAILQKMVMTNLQKYSLDSHDDGANQIVTATSGIIFDLLSSLSKSFLQQLKKVLTYPAFDKLWLRILHVMGFFLGAPHGYDASVGERSPVLRLATEEAKVWMKTILRELTSHGVFNERVGLSTVTNETLLLFRDFNPADF